MGRCRFATGIFLSLSSSAAASDACPVGRESAFSTTADFVIRALDAVPSRFWGLRSSGHWGSGRLAYPFALPVPDAVFSPQCFRGGGPRKDVEGKTVAETVVRQGGAGKAWTEGDS